MGRRALVFSFFALLPAAASAGQTVAVFPFDMVLQKSEEDYFSGPSHPTKDEERRLALAREELQKLFSADSRYEVVDLAALSGEIRAVQPIYTCNGCEIDLAGKAKAELAMTSVIDKISETHLSLNVAIVDVAQMKVLRNASVMIQGNTDESWLHGVRWLVKNRLLAEGKPQ
jgi:hypothetical protein